MVDLLLKTLWQGQIDWMVLVAQGARKVKPTSWTIPTKEIHITKIIAQLGNTCCEDVPVLLQGREVIVASRADDIL